MGGLKMKYRESRKLCTRLTKIEIFQNKDRNKICG